MEGLDVGGPHTVISVVNPSVTCNVDTLSKCRLSVAGVKRFLSGLGGSEDARLLLILAAASFSDLLDCWDIPSTGDIAGGISSQRAILLSQQPQAAQTRVLWLRRPGNGVTICARKRQVSEQEPIQLRKKWKDGGQFFSDT